VGSSNAVMLSPVGQRMDCETRNHENLRPEMTGLRIPGPFRLVEQVAIDLVLHAVVIMLSVNARISLGIGREVCAFGAATLVM